MGSDPPVLMQSQFLKLVPASNVEGGVGPVAGKKGVGKDPVPSFDDDITRLKLVPEVLHLLVADEGFTSLGFPDPCLADPVGNKALHLIDDRVLHGLGS